MVVVSDERRVALFVISVIAKHGDRSCAVVALEHTKLSTVKPNFCIGCFILEKQPHLLDANTRTERCLPVSRVLSLLNGCSGSFGCKSNSYLSLRSCRSLSTPRCKHLQNQEIKLMRRQGYTQFRTASGFTPYPCTTPFA